MDNSCCFSLYLIHLFKCRYGILILKLRNWSDYLVHFRVINFFGVFSTTFAMIKLTNSFKYLYKNILYSGILAWTYLTEQIYTFKLIKTYDYGEITASFGKLHADRPPSCFFRKVGQKKVAHTFKMIKYMLNYTCAKFGALFHPVTIWPKFGHNRPSDNYVFFLR